MRSPERRNPASSHALTVFEVREMPIGTRLLVCTLNDYHIDRDIRRPLQRRIDGFTPVVFRGTIPMPDGYYDAGTGSWVVFDQNLRFSMSSTHEITRRWGRSSRFAYEPSALGLTMPADGDAPSWNEYIFVIRPGHEEAARREYPRSVRPY